MYCWSKHWNVENFFVFNWQVADNGWISELSNDGIRHAMLDLDEQQDNLLFRYQSIVKK